MFFLKSSRGSAGWAVRGYLAAAGVLMLCCTAVGLRLGSLPDRMADVDASPVRPMLILDPGHGGEDSGAVAPDGTMEKHLNLDIAQRVGDLADLLGYSAMLTRMTDEMLYDRYGDMTEYGGRKKTYDLRNRLRLAEESGGTVFCSIHMNKFPSAECRGLQVYYSPNSAESSSYAALVQSYSKTFLDSTNHRETKKADSSIYLLHRIEIPAILVECGFLSNPEECALLNTSGYRQKTAAVLTAAKSPARAKCRRAAFQSSMRRSFTTAKGIRSIQMRLRRRSVARWWGQEL